MPDEASGGTTEQETVSIERKVEAITFAEEVRVRVRASV